MTELLLAIVVDVGAFHSIGVETSKQDLVENSGCACFDICHRPRNTNFVFIVGECVPIIIIIRTKIIPNNIDYTIKYNNNPFPGNFDTNRHRE